MSGKADRDEFAEGCRRRGSDRCHQRVVEPARRSRLRMGQLWQNLEDNYEPGEPEACAG
jgi:hypothetical protein